MKESEAKTNDLGDLLGEGCKAMSNLCQLKKRQNCWKSKLMFCKGEYLNIRKKIYSSIFVLGLQKLEAELDELEMPAL